MINDVRNKTKKKSNLLDEFKVKKNIDIINSKSKIIKIKTNNKDTIKSMDESFKTNEVLFWGLNKVDSIILNLYEDNFTKENKKPKVLDKKENKIYKIFDPNEKYSVNDLNFLNKEYEKIEIKLDKLTDLNDECEKLMDLQDNLTNIIENLQTQKDNNLENSNNDTVFTSDSTILVQQSDSDSDLDSDSDSDSDSNIENKKKVGRKKILKPYFWIGKIPQGYREATQEEAILKKKVSCFGKNKVSREIYNMYDVTGTICVNNLKEKDIKLKIIALKGKLRFYKKEYDYESISFNSGKNIGVHREEIKNKIEELQYCYKKTADVINFYVQNLNNINNINTQKSNSKIIKSNSKIIKSNSKIIKSNSENLDNSYDSDKIKIKNNKSKNVSVNK